MDKTIQPFAELLEKRIGINIDAIGEACFQKIIRDQMKNLLITECDEYYIRLINSYKDFQDFVEKLIVTETWFFRTPSSLEFLSYYLIQVLIPSLSVERKIRILSVPCSSGEEPYSIAMQLLESGLSAKQFVIDGIDISHLALKKARARKYTKYSFRGMNENDPRIHAYFDFKDELYTIKKSISSCVQFHYGNILEKSLEIYEYSYDVIFCRNLFIYMVPDAQQKLLSNLEKLLSSNGVLIVSAVETELLRRSGYVAYPYPKSFAFQKKSLFKIVEKEIPEVKKIQEPQKNIVEIKSTVSEDVNLLKRAKECADSGHFDEASEICNNYLSLKGPNATAYFILGLIEHAADKDNEAEEYFLKTIYLEPQHYEALIYLALLAEKKGEAEQAKLFFNRAKRLNG